MTPTTRTEFKLTMQPMTSKNVWVKLSLDTDDPEKENCLTYPVGHVFPIQGKSGKVYELLVLAHVANGMLCERVR